MPMPAATTTARATRPALTDRIEPLALALAAAPADAAALPRDLDEFLAGVERRAYRVAELALGQREDALDIVQEAMIRLLRYRERPAQEWSPLFWGILRRQLTDKYRRNAVRRRVLAVFGKAEAGETDPLEMLPDPHEDPARRLQQARSWTPPKPRRRWAVPKAR
jgi:RNA polymerase sigma-70 factor (ECF subfamily)